MLDERKLIMIKEVNEIYDFDCNIMNCSECDLYHNNLCEDYLKTVEQIYNLLFDITSLEKL